LFLQLALVIVFKQVYQVDIITTDLKKAFNTVNHQLLTHKLECLGIGYPLLPWLRSYMTGRKQFVSISGSSSKIYAITSGFSRDDQLSPLLFSLFVKFIILVKCPSKIFTLYK